MLLTDVVKRLECKDPSTPQYGVIMITAITSYQNIDYNKTSWQNLVGRCTVKSKSIWEPMKYVEGSHLTLHNHFIKFYRASVTLSNGYYYNSC